MTWHDIKHQQVEQAKQEHHSNLMNPTVPTVDRAISANNATRTDSRHLAVSPDDDRGCHAQSSMDRHRSSSPVLSRGPSGTEILKFNSV